MKPRKPTLPEVLPAFVNYHDEHLAWGSLHIVLDDGNVDDDSVIFSANHALEDGDLFGYALALMLLQMSKTQRKKLGRIA